MFYWEWFPQIVYNHHQTGPAGTVMFAPPFRDPFNYNFDPLIPVGIDLVAASMHSRFEAEGKPGVTMRSGSTYSTWWNGGLRTTVVLPQHDRPAHGDDRQPDADDASRSSPSSSCRAPTCRIPIAPQEWHFRQSIDYSLTANCAVLDIAAAQRENLLFNIWQMGQQLDRPRHRATRGRRRRARSTACGSSPKRASPRRAAGGPVGDATGAGSAVA